MSSVVTIYLALLELCLGRRTPTYPLAPTPCPMSPVNQGIEADDVVLSGQGTSIGDWAAVIHTGAGMDLGMCLWGRCWCP